MKLSWYMLRLFITSFFLYSFLSSFPIQGSLYTLAFMYHYNFFLCVNLLNLFSVSVFVSDSPTLSRNAVRMQNCPTCNLRPFSATRDTKICILQTRSNISPPCLDIYQRCQISVSRQQSNENVFVDEFVINISKFDERTSNMSKYVL